MENKIVQQYLKKFETPLALNLGIVGGLLFLHAFGFLSIPASQLNWIIGYASLNLLSAPFAIRERFVTPNIVARKCNFCGSYLRSVKLVCPKCKASSEEPPQ